ncbi:hypothetical protein JCM6882_003924 [Rhodosporidiobolus microsporus]
MLSRPLSLALWAVLSAAGAQAAWDCTGLSIGGASFDLSKLAGVHEWEDQQNTPPTVTKTRYQLSLCAPLPEPSSSAPEDDCPSGSRLCQKTFSARSGLEDRLISVIPVAGDIGSGDLSPQASALDGVKAGEAWTLELAGGTYNGVGQKVRIEMRCDEKATETAPTTDSYDGKAGLLQLKWTTASACATSSDGESPPPSNPDPEKKPEPPATGDSSGMGFFGWFFTLLFLGFIAYLGIGIWQNYTQYGATGWDAVPHRDVWRDLPYVIGDLFKGRGASRNGYSSLG